MTEPQIMDELSLSCEQTVPKLGLSGSYAVIAFYISSSYASSKPLSKRLTIFLEILVFTSRIGFPWLECCFIGAVGC